MNPKLAKYVKETGELISPVSTSVTLEKRHVEMIKKFNLNLSKMIRDFLDEFISTEGKDNEEKKS